jgi:transposase
VTKLGHDRTQLVRTALKAQEAAGNEEITVLADRGFDTGLARVRAREEDRQTS